MLPPRGDRRVGRKEIARYQGVSGFWADLIVYLMFPGTYVLRELFVRGLRDYI